MALNPNIILQGRTPDIMGAYGRGQEMGARGNEIQRQNKLAQLYQQQGAQIFAGDQNALNALAQYSPETALGIQQKRQTMERLNAQERRAMEIHAANMSEAERAAQANRVKNGLMQGFTAYQSGDLNSLNQVLSAAGEQTISSLDQFPAVAAKYEGLLEALEGVKKFSEPPKPADEYGRYVQEMRDAGQQPLSRIDFHKAKQKQSSIEVMPDGTVRVVEGGGTAGAKFTEAQSKDTVYATRARGALEMLEPVAESLTSRTSAVAEDVPLGLAKAMQSEEYQVASQAGTEFLQAILRKDTGAAITQGEIDSYGKTYLPQPGDKPKVLEAKRQARIRAINALESGMNSAQMLARDRALIKATEEIGVEAQPTDSGGLQVGVTEDGYRFLGGDPGDAKNWEKVE